MQFGEVLGFGDAGFGDEDGGVFDHVDEAQGVGDVGGHALEVAVVDAQQGVARFGEADVGQDAEEVVGGVDLEQDGELELRFEYRPATLEDWPADQRDGKKKPPADPAAAPAPRSSTTTPASACAA